MKGHEGPQAPTEPGNTKEGHGEPDKEKEGELHLGPHHPDPDRQRPFPGPSIGINVPEVVHHQDGGGQGSHPGPRQKDFRPESQGLDPIGAPYGHEPKEHEDEEVAEPVVGQGKGPTGVGHRANQGGEADDKNREATHPYEVDPHDQASPSARNAPFRTVLGGRRPAWVALRAPPDPPYLPPRT